MDDRAEQTLRACEAFKTFSPSELRTLVEQGRTDTFAPGQVIIAYGQPGRFFGVMLDGEAEAVIDTPSGERRRIGRVQPGDVLGEISLLTGEPTNADVIALRRCELWLIPQDVISSALAVSPAFSTTQTLTRSPFSPAGTPAATASLTLGCW